MSSSDVLGGRQPSPGSRAYELETENANLRARLQLLRAEIVRLAGACQAAMAADAAGDPDPLAAVRAELARPPDQAALHRDKATLANLPQQR